MNRDKRITEEDFTGEPDQWSERMDSPRGLSQPASGLYTPHDFGGHQDTSLITIRKLRLSDGGEVWNNGRGVPRNAVTFDGLDGPTCRTLLVNDAGKLHSVGSAIEHKSDSNAVRWVGSTVGVLSKRSRSAADQPYDSTVGWADFPGPNNSFQSIGPQFACLSQGLLWTAGSLADGTRVVQAFDPDTLQGAFVTVLPEYGDATTDSTIVQIAPSPSGCLVRREYGGAYSYPNTMPVTVVNLISPAGEITATLRVEHGYQAFVGTPAYGRLYDDATPAGVTYAAIAGVRCGRNGRVYISCVPYNVGAAQMHLAVTDTGLVLASLNAGTGGADTAYASIDSGSKDHGILNDVAAVSDATYNAWNSDLHVTSDAVLITENFLTMAGDTSQITPGGGLYVYVAGLTDPWTSSGGQHQRRFDLDGTEEYLVPFVPASYFDDAGNSFGFYTGWDPSPQYLVKLDSSGYVVWEAAHPVTVPFRVVSDDDAHYLIGTGGSGIYKEVAKIDSATGAVIWHARHSSDLGSDDLFDGLIVGDHLFVAGQGSTYDPT